MAERIRSFLLSAREHLPAVRDGDVLVLAVLLGLGGGLSEAVATVVRYRILHEAAGEWVSGEIYWMAPLAAITVLLSIAVAGVAVRHAGGFSCRVNGAVLFLLSVLCCYSALRRLSGGIHPAAVSLVSVGFATQLLRVARRLSENFWPRLRIAVAAAVALLTFWAAYQPQRTESHNELQAPPVARAADSNRPNILLIVWDTVRARNLSVYGYERQTTPNLERLGKDAAVFDAAITTAPWTLPAHASLFTGRYHHEHNADRESPLDRTFPTLAEVLRDQGYATAGFIANTYWCGRGFGLDRGFQYYDDQLRVTPEAILTSWRITKTTQATLRSTLGNHQAVLRKSASTVTASLLRWIDRGHTPFFAFVNLYDAHEPYIPPDNFGFRFAAGTPRSHWDDRKAEKFSESELSQMRAAYDSSIYYLDHQLGVLLNELRRRRVLDNTIIILTSDHGETLGEHQPDLLGHSNSVYYDVLHVPLVIWSPPLVPAGTWNTPVSLADVPATIVDLVFRGKYANPFPGRSLLQVVPSPAEVSGQRILVSQANPARWHRLRAFSTSPIANGPLHSLVDASLHYIVNARGTEQLFDVKSDPWERHDLSRTSKWQNALAGFRAERERLLKRAKSGPVPPQAARR